MDTDFVAGLIGLTQRQQQAWLCLRQTEAIDEGTTLQDYLAQRLRAGASGKELGAECGVSRQTIVDWCQRFGIVVPQGRKPNAEVTA